MKTSRPITNQRLMINLKGNKCSFQGLMLNIQNEFHRSIGKFLVLSIAAHECLKIGSCPTLSYKRNSHTSGIRTTPWFEWCHSHPLYRLPQNHSSKITEVKFVLNENNENIHGSRRQIQTLRLFLF